MTILTSDQIRAALEGVIDHVTGQDVISAGLISGVTLRGGKVGFLVSADADDMPRAEALRERCVAEVQRLQGVESVTAVLTADAPPAKMQPARPAQWNRDPVEGVKHMIAVASGKGGVGKSTVAVNLALALAGQGMKVGLLDADIYGPSVPRMMGLANVQPEINHGKMLPPVAHGIACMSMGFITGDTAAVMRGPMISKTLAQLLRGTAWGNLDVLLIDMPPGTGDIHLSLAQQAPLAGAVIVTTPQEVAVDDARKALSMFGKFGVSVLGVVENMRGDVFGQGGGERLAEEAGVPFLGAVPLDAMIRQQGDAGSSKPGDAFAKVARLLREMLPASLQIGVAGNQG